jgi:hypothetical protein
VPTTTTPTLNLPPAPVANVHISKTAPIRLSWTLPAASDLGKVVVLRSVVPKCPAALTEGTPIGGTGRRSTQVDRKAVPGTAYCYAIYVIDTAGHTSPRALKFGEVPIPAPSAVTTVTATPNPAQHSITLAWAASQHATGYRVYRTVGATCSTAGQPIATQPARGYVDATAKAGTTYCYSVVAVGAAKKVAKPATSGPTEFASVTKPKAPPATTPVTKNSPGLLGSSIVRLAAAVGSGIVIFGLLVLLAVRLLPRLRGDSWEYGGGALGTVRGALQRYDTGALVIPLVILVIGLVLLGAAALTL